MAKESRKRDGQRAPPVVGPLRQDAVAGLVLGVQSVPDGLATGLLAGVNPLAGLYGYMVGTVTGALGTSSTFMAVQGTGAMAMLIADVACPQRVRRSDPGPGHPVDPDRGGHGGGRAAAARHRSCASSPTPSWSGSSTPSASTSCWGSWPTSPATAAEGANRVIRAVNTLLHPGRLDGRTLLVGVATIALIVLLERTPLRSLGLVVAVLATSVAVHVLGWDQVATLERPGRRHRRTPHPRAAAAAPRARPCSCRPSRSRSSGLVQGAGISANFPNPDGSYPDASRDFLGQGVANVASGVFQGMPVGGSVSASALNKEAGARSRWSLVFASAVMAVVIVAFGERGGPGGHACAGGAADAHRLPHDQAGGPAVGLADRTRPAGRAGRHLPADDGDPAPVRRAGGRGPVGRCCTSCASPTRSRSAGGSATRTAIWSRSTRPPSCRPTRWSCCSPTGACSSPPPPSSRRPCQPSAPRRSAPW